MRTQTLLRLLIASALLVVAAKSSPAAEQKPNVVIILSDDQAWTDYSFAGHPHIRTPHLDQLAKEGALFLRGYVPSSLCRPSLMTLITGQYAHQHGITGNDPPKGTDRREMLKHVRRAQTLPKLLATKGYSSFQCGKWWEGNFKEGGFTSGMTHGDPAKGGRHGDLGLKIGREGLQPVADFLDRNGEQPFFLWYAPMLPHSPHTPPQRLLDKYRPLTDSLHVARYWAMCEWWDESVGELLTMLEKRDLTKNTIVVYLADNGWLQDPESPKYAPRSKRSPNEGGIRTPIIVRWPAGIKPLRDDTTPVSSIDLAPTMLAACGVEIPKNLPGINLLDGEKIRQRSFLFGEIFEHDVVDIDKPGACLMYRWCLDVREPAKSLPKLILSADGKTAELYDVKTDPQEEHDLATKQPERVESLRLELDRWWKP